MSPEELTQTMNNLGVDPAFVRRVLDEPMLVCEDQSHLIVSNLRALMADPEFKAMTEPQARRETDDEFWGIEGYRAQYRPYDVDNGVLIIPVKGTLIHRFSYAHGNNATGYEYIRRAFDRGMADHDVSAIMFDINSPGGQAAGNFELVDHIVEHRGQKPIRAHAADLALSGGYSLATVADAGQLSVTSSGHTGSVGVVVSARTSPGCWRSSVWRFRSSKPASGKRTGTRSNPSLREHEYESRRVSASSTPAPFRRLQITAECRMVPSAKPRQTCSMLRSRSRLALPIASATWKPKWPI